MGFFIDRQNFPLRLETVQRFKAVRGFRPILIAVCYIFSANAFGVDLGRYGASFAVVEEDGESLLKKAAAKKLSNGGKEKILTDAQRRTIEYFSNLPPLKNVSVAKESRIRTVDLTYRVPNDIVDDKGRVVVAKGAAINPLEVRPWSKKVFFIDARDPRQLDLVKQRAADRDKIILTAGNLFKAQEYLKRDLFIDQNPAGVLAYRMNITRVPAIASQQDSLLRIEEVVAP